MSGDRYGREPGSPHYGERGRQARMNGLRMVMSETRRSRMGDRLPEGKRGRAAWLGGMPIDAHDGHAKDERTAAVSPTPVREEIAADTTAPRRYGRDALTPEDSPDPDQGGMPDRLRREELLRELNEIDERQGRRRA